MAEGMNMDPNSAVRDGELNPSNPGPAEDAKLVSSLLQMLDPASPVREGEGPDGPLANMYTKLQSLESALMQGYKLAPEARKTLANQAVSLMDQMNPDMMDPGSAVRGGEMPMSQIPMDPGSAVRPSEMPSQDGMTYGPSSGVTVAPSNVMSLDDAIAAGLVNPTRPQARPTAPMQSMRPQMRPSKLGGR